MSDPVEERAVEMLRSAHLRVTGPRVAVLTAMLRRQHPVAASDLIDDVASMRLSEVTVYRNLNRLADSGVVRRVDTTERRRRFEVLDAGESDHEHAHFVCDGCGTVTCIEGDVPPVAPVSLPDGYRVDAHRVVLHGRCATCD
ncbi:MAG: transcriptional repressor [Deltaproteobacteria bacterium]|nr:MAG: transcriptional repressor [Deltaproteobacteria bacterium]